MSAFSSSRAAAAVAALRHGIVVRTSPPCMSCHAECVPWPTCPTSSTCSIPSFTIFCRHARTHPSESSRDSADWWRPSFRDASPEIGCESLYEHRCDRTVRTAGAETRCWTADVKQTPPLHCKAMLVDLVCATREDASQAAEMLVFLYSRITKSFCGAEKLPEHGSKIGCKHASRLQPSTTAASACWSTVCGACSTSRLHNTRLGSKQLRSRSQSIVHRRCTSPNNSAN